MCKEDKLTIQKGLEMITTDIDEVRANMHRIYFFMGIYREELDNDINDNNANYVKESTKELLQKLAIMKDDMAYIEKRLKEIKGQASFIKIIRASQNIDRLLKKFKKGENNE